MMIIIITMTIAVMAAMIRGKGLRFLEVLGLLGFWAQAPHYFVSLRLTCSELGLGVQGLRV